MTFSLVRCVLLVVACPGLSSALLAWNYDSGHRIVNQVALASLPAEFPAFVKTPESAERIAFLSGEGDRFRNVSEGAMRQTGGSWTDHFIDLERLPMAGLDPAKVPSFRLDFVVAFAAGRQAHADRFPVIDAARNTDHTAEWEGFLPWRIFEDYLRLKSAFSYLKAFEELGTPDEIANARANVVYYMGVMGHYVGDASQPLHTTMQYDGWKVGPNPKGFTAQGGFHSWVDSGFFYRAGMTPADILPRAVPARPISLQPQADGRDPLFVHVMNFIIAQNELVEPLYQMEKDGKFTNNSQPPAPEGREFLRTQILKGGQLLGDLWVTAWRSAPEDTFLRGTLLRRQEAAAGKSGPAPKAP
jgi:hypothetical protein